MAAEKQLRGRCADSKVEETGLRETVLSAVRADERDQLQQHLYLQSAEGDADEG